MQKSSHKRSKMPFPKPLSGLIKDSLANAGLAERFRDIEIWRLWRSVVGDTLASRAQPLRIIDGTLTVAVSSAPWMQELRYMTGMMKDKLNSALGAEVVREIVLKPGRVAVPVDDIPEPDVIACRPLDDRQLEQIRVLSEEIKDTETRVAFAEMMRSTLEHQL